MGTRSAVRLAVGIALVLPAVGSVAFGHVLPASADPPAPGTRIFDEPFTGPVVHDSAWRALGDACLTGATAPPAASDAQIPTCASHLVGPVPGTATPGYLQLTDAST